MKPLIIAIVGPTAVGKTELGLELADFFNGEIISGDSMQVYRGMDIGTAKASNAEQNRVPHHLIDIRTPETPFSVADFKQEATVAINAIHQKNKLPIIVGGTGLYVNSVLYDYQFKDVPEDPEFRASLETFAKAKGNHALHEQLQNISPEKAQAIHPNNIRRVIRQLEIHHVTGKVGESGMENDAVESPYRPIVFGLTMDREQLYERINQRVDDMLQKGLVDEVQYLLDQGYENTSAMNAIGYKELIPYIKGDTSLASATEQLKLNSRRFAKRQFTWFRNKMDLTWFDLSENREQKIHNMIKIIQEYQH
ncbi:tRNA (adenosine(37)-N6)-dimethylallyltransferase MiaA [Salisediminibacterium beveridgei]|uniref:tRNA dimethylallyltransferase n=1 Tax=Salisediminibacterium beveridgei TaxID=632773 RepID=A0A1D7QVS6_9BACI|nr:tRNA (adenosine(37)-N6)-dimethylallyltransferase MiaA [Salisediminibacterium beveridgei]AOM83107.1 tRNA delta(2)-isopentenylpyrophosphate transferase [Salisediminibacterium beveridgei]